MLMRVTAWGKTNLSRLGSALRILVEWGFRLQLSGSLGFGWGRRTQCCAHLQWDGICFTLATAG